MPYSLEISRRADARFFKVGKKDRLQIEAIKKKLEEILENPYRFKPLRGAMKGQRRVHILSCFVLTYEIDEARKTVRILDYEHHDKAYRTRAVNAG